MGRQEIGGNGRPGVTMATCWPVVCALDIRAGRMPQTAQTFSVHRLSRDLSLCCNEFSDTATHCTLRVKTTPLPVALSHILTVSSSLLAPNFNFSHAGPSTWAAEINGV